MFLGVFLDENNNNNKIISIAHFPNAQMRFTVSNKL